MKTLLDRLTRVSLAGVRLSRMREEFTPKLISVLREGYALPQFRADVVAGLTVAVIALPLAMALAVASGASPDKGEIDRDEQSLDLPSKAIGPHEELGFFLFAR